MNKELFNQLRNLQYQIIFQVHLITTYKNINNNYF